MDDGITDNFKLIYLLKSHPNSGQFFSGLKMSNPFSVFWDSESSFTFSLVARNRVHFETSGQATVPGCSEQTPMQPVSVELQFSRAMFENDVINRIFVVTTKLEVLLNKKYVPSSKNEINLFFKRMQEIEQGNLPANFVEDGIQFFYKNEGGGMFFVACCEGSADPMMMDEFLKGLHHITKFFLGAVTVDVIRANVVVMMEVLDEVVAMGFPQEMSPDRLKPYIHTESSIPHLSQEEDMTRRLFGIEMKPVGATKVVSSPSSDQEAKNEIYVDLIERITADVDLKGRPSRLEINGSMQIKSRVVGNPLIRLAINEDVEIKEGQVKAFGNYAQLDRCTFHDCVNLDEFNKRVLRIFPPAGEFSAMTYSLNSDLPLTLPVRLEVVVKDIEGSRDLNVSLRVYISVPKKARASYVKVNLKVPRNTTGLSQQLGGPGQVAELTPESQLLWRVDRLPGGSEAGAHFRLINASRDRLASSEVGPATLDFEIAEYTFTGLQIRWLKIMGPPDTHPKKWLRSVTLSNSVTVKLH